MTLTPDQIIERLSHQLDDLPPIRGDHDLNPGMTQHRTLTPAAVLVGLVDRPSGLSVLLTQRTDHLHHHPGQISFPGGHMDPGDETAEDTALRETEEEVGLHRRHIAPIGRLGEYVTRTGFSITPVVAIITPPFDVTPDSFEVEEIFEVPLAFLLDPANHQRHSRDVRGQIREFHAMPYEDYYIWGATAGMLINLYEVLHR
ncbi:MAG: CoA pyrophosphatase [Rhodospirillales bacterium]|nr:CoA pyrophosphatase [Rhodospirillales bacterium]